MEKLRQNATREELELKKQNMHNFIGGPVKVRTMVLMLQNNLDTDSKTIYLDSMEARVHFQTKTIMQFDNTIAQYQSWH